MQITNNYSKNSLNFNARFINNKQYKEIYNYAKKQETFSEFKNVISKLNNLPDCNIIIDFGTKNIQAPCDYGGDLKRGLIHEKRQRFVSFNVDNRRNNIEEYTDLKISPLEFAYKKILSLGDITTDLYHSLFTNKFNPLKNFKETPQEIDLKKIKDIEEQKLIDIIKEWDKQDENIFTKFKSKFHTYPSSAKDSAIFENMSVLDYLTNVKKSRFFDFNSEYMQDKVNYNDFYNLSHEIEKERAAVKPNEIEQFLYDISQDKKLSKKMVKEFSVDPRKGAEIKERIIKLLGNNEQAYDKFYRWYHDEQYGYKKAYSDYYNDEIYAKAKNLTTLVKQSPNVAPWAFLNKAKELGIEPTIGLLPKPFGKLDDFRLLVKEIIKYDKDFNTKYSRKKYQYLQNVDTYITINNKTFKVEKLKGGMSAKTKYKVTTDGDNTYIIKFNEYDVNGNTWRSTQIRENQAMRGDSPYLDAMVDFYLKTNHCKNAANIQFFDYNSKAAVYKLTKGKQPTFENNMFNNLYIFNNSDLAKDTKRLGVILNDINDGNFIKDNKGNYILIDTGHADYINIFRPMVQGRHISLSNLCGRNL